MKKITLDFDGYWREANKDSIPRQSGIYCVYTCTYNATEHTVSIKKMLYIGESTNVHDRTELWKEPPEPLLEKIAQLLSSGSNEWTGTPTELCSILQLDIQPNALTRKLNINAGRLLNEYKIFYENSRSRSERKVKLSRLEQA